MCVYIEDRRQEETRGKNWTNATTTHKKNYSEKHAKKWEYNKMLVIFFSMGVAFSLIFRCSPKYYFLGFFWWWLVVWWLGVVIGLWSCKVLLIFCDNFLYFDWFFGGGYILNCFKILYASLCVFVNFMVDR